MFGSHLAGRGGEGLADLKELVVILKEEASTNGHSEWDESLQED